MEIIHCDWNLVQFQIFSNFRWSEVSGSMGCSSSQQQQYAAFKNSPPLTKEQFEQQMAAALSEKTARVHAHNDSKIEATKRSQ